MVYSESGVAEKHVTSLKGSSSTSYVESHSVSLTENASSKPIIRDKSIIFQLICLFYIKNLDSKSQNDVVNYVMTTVRETLYQQIYFKQGVRIQSSDIEITIERLVGNDDLMDRFIQDVESGRFFMSTPLHIALYKGTIDIKEWSDIVFWSTVANAGINREMTSLLPHIGIENKRYLKNLLNNESYRNSNSFKSSLGIPGRFNRDVMLSQKSIIMEMMTRIIFGDDTPVWVQFITKGQ